MTDTTGTLSSTHPTHGTATEDAHAIIMNRVSWGAIFAGVVVALVVQVLLTMLGVVWGIVSIAILGTARPP